jgi:addiction module HigA family antidote
VFWLRQCITLFGLTTTDAAAALGVTRTTLSELVNGTRGISAEMAVRLSKVLGGARGELATAEGAVRARADRLAAHQAQAVGVGLVNFASIARLATGTA